MEAVARGTFTIRGTFVGIYVNAAHPATTGLRSQNVHPRKCWTIRRS